MQHIPLIDCHCHIEARWFKDDCFSFRQILKRCDAFGVNTIIVSVDCASGQPEINLVQLREVFRDYHVKLAVTLGFTPPANQSELVTLKHHLEMATLWVNRHYSPVQLCQPVSSRRARLRLLQAPPMVWRQARRSLPCDRHCTSRPHDRHGPPDSWDRQRRFRDTRCMSCDRHAWRAML